ncbi:4Fe-4S binding protein [Candidatus Bathyarchaeota archaeon]|nr:4Fe-4S binding protein [Candidatus Bathyarchaeota archaeon]
MVIRKIVHIDEDLCNGCGQCIPKCAEGALQIVNGKAKIVSETYCDGLGACLGQCPQGAITVIDREAAEFDEKAVEKHLDADKAKASQTPAKPQWPVKINLIPRQAPFFNHANLLIVADCAPVAYPDLQKNMPGKRIMIGCPKFEDARGYAEKLQEILKLNDVASVTVVHMEVPCCSGLKWAVDKALQASGKQIPVKQYIMTIGGELSEQ